MSAPSIVRTAASQPWAFSQEAPLTTADFCKQAERRGFESLREEQLRDLWRVGAVAPFVEIRSKQLHDPAPSAIPEPSLTGTWLAELRRARDSGRLTDPEELGFRPQLRFSRPRTNPHSLWWNGLLYSRWQLLDLHEMREVVTQGRWRQRRDQIKWRSAQPNDFGLNHARTSRRRSAVLVAIESRYLPTVVHDWVTLSNAAVEEWETYRAAFDATTLMAKLGLELDDLLRLADGMLLRLDRLDPLGRDWSELVRRAPRRAWDELSGDALLAMEYRIGGEMLLQCYEDLAERGVCAPVGDRADIFHSAHQRLSYRSQPLDANLSSLGLSPHPGVVLVVEGETEEVLVPRVRDYIRIPNNPELVQSVVMRGVKHDLTKLAAFASAPLVDRQEVEVWRVAKPPTRLMVVVDPDKPFDSAASVELERKKILDEIVAVVRAQGVEPGREDIDTLVSIRTWTASCFEFEHFTDLELADALLAQHPNCGGLDRERLASAIVLHRSNGQDIRRVWTNWTPAVAKKDLAHLLWPTLKAKLDRAASSEHEPVPSVAQALIDAYHEAAQRPRGHFLIRGTALSFEEDLDENRREDAP
jgi:hypothetical protein